MPKRSTPPLQRWVHEPERPGVDAELGELFRALPEEAPLDARALAGVGRRLTAPAPRAARSARYVMVMAAVLCSATGAALAQWGQPLIEALSPQVAPSAVPAPVTAPRRASPARAMPGGAPSAVAPSPQLQTELPDVAAPVAPGAQRLPGPGDVAAPATAAAGVAEQSSLARESELLSRALRALRREHDAATALALLDQYRSQFPAGVMALEASTARVDALLMLGRRASALALLGGLPLERSPRRAELQLLRAELNAEHDCARALTDFDAVLAGTAAGGLAERALYGRAGCQLRLGRAAAGRADLQSYLARFPDGRFAEQVRARLAE